MASLDEVRDSGFARPIPLHVAFTARGHPVVGTDPEYFRFRGSPSTQENRSSSWAKLCSGRRSRRASAGARRPSDDRPGQCLRSGRAPIR
jgi:hypothetical protein